LPADWVRAQQRFVEAVAALSGVSSAAIGYGAPLNGVPPQAAFSIQGERPADAAAAPRAGLNAVGPDYFRTLQIPLIKGREFSSADTAGSQPAAIVSLALARRCWGDLNPVGQTIRMAGAAGADPITIVGVVGDVREVANSGPSPMLYRPYTQTPRAAMGYVALAAGQAATAGAGIIKAIHAIDPDQPVTFLRPITGDFSDQIYPQRIGAGGLLTLSTLALMLAGAGVFGLTSYTVRMRTQEFGIRLALGARPGQIIAGVVPRVARIAIAGCSCGLLASLILNRTLEFLLFQVPPGDASMLLLAAVLLTVVAIAGAWFAARGITRLEPAMIVQAAPAFTRKHWR
jgi:putative ABC transport system permease protein